MNINMLCYKHESFLFFFSVEQKMFDEMFAPSKAT